MLVLVLGLWFGIRSLWFVIVAWLVLIGRLFGWFVWLFSCGWVYYVSGDLGLVEWFWCCDLFMVGFCWLVYCTFSVTEVVGIV